VSLVHRNANRSTFVLVFTTLPLLLHPRTASARIPVLPAQVSIPALVSPASAIFRGVVSNVNMSSAPVMTNAIANFSVDRWYKGSGSSHLQISFSYNWNWPANGHYCIDFKPGTYWIVFATGDGLLKLVDDCDGALAVSRRLASESCKKGSNIFTCMVADFAAGLDDDEPNARITSIQRLGNLKSRATLPLLHSYIQSSSGKEYEWAVYAALRVGDREVLTKVEELLQRLPSQTLPEELMPLEIMSITDPAAVSDLLAILAGDPRGHFGAIVALGKIGDPKAVPAIAPHLSDPDEYVRYQALEADVTPTFRPNRSTI
jgi:hypothetical protein